MISKIFSVVVIAFLVIPFSARAADIHFNDEINVTQMTGDYLVNIQLQISDVTSLAGLSLIGIKDDGEISLPFNVMNLSSYLSSAVQSNGNFNLQFSLSMADNPNGSWVQFFIVDTVTLDSMNISDFNPDNNSQFTVFSGTEPAPISYNGTPGGNGDPGGNPGTNPGSVSTTSAYNPNFVLTTTLQNPLGEDGDIDIIGFLQGLFEAAVKIMLPFLVLYTMWSGFMFVKARGNPDELDEAKENFKWVIIGALVVFGSWIIAEALKGTVDQITAYLMNEVINLL